LLFVAILVNGRLKLSLDNTMPTGHILALFSQNNVGYRTQDRFVPWMIR